MTPGYHGSMDTRTAIPRPILSYYPLLWQQESLQERVHLLNSTQERDTTVLDAGHPPAFEDFGTRESYETSSPVSFPGASRSVRLGDVVLARSGDKGSNVNIGLFVQTARQWDWLRSFMTKSTMRQLIGDDDWDDSFSIERVEFQNIFAVHFVVYGILGKGVSSSTRLDGFGKGFADYIRNKVVGVPEEVLAEQDRVDSGAEAARL
jgi:hypothetical protein